MDDNKRKDMGTAFKSQKRQAEERISLLRIVAALYKCIPANFHKMLEYDYQDIREMMKTVAKSARANFVYFGKQSATDIFNDIPIPHTTFNSKYNHIGDELCLHLLGYNKKKERYAQCPKIFYPVGQGGKAHSNIFQAPALVKLLSVTLHGQSSLQSNKTMKTTNGDLWEATTISAGAIASAATVMIESTLTFKSTIKTFEYFNQNLFSSKKNHLGFMADAGKESDDLDVEEDILCALQQPELDHETEVDTSIDEENLSVTLMPLATLMPLPQAKDAAVPISSEPTYVDVSDDEQSTVIPTAIQNSNVDQAPGDGITVVSMGPPAPGTITKPARGQGQGQGSKKTTSGQGEANQGSTKGHGAGTSVRAPSDSVATVPKAPGGCQLRTRGGNKQNIKNSSSLVVAKSNADNVDLDESIEEDLEYSAANIS
ncbi:hypothetical protein F5146DRAFT_1004105 [Armillaria mellea]|nr:hypothetical protein F5146DRAFT_1004105 [Armillaria mellea]